MSNKELDSIRTDCAMWFVTEVIGQRWNMNIILELINAVEHKSKSLAYTDIANLIPDISSRTLTRRLKYLENVGIIEVKNNSKTPKKVRYRLAKSGLRLIPIIGSLREWSLEFGTTESDECLNNTCRHSLGIANFVKQLDIIS